MTREEAILKIEENANREIDRKTDMQCSEGEHRHLSRLIEVPAWTVITEAIEQQLLEQNGENASLGCGALDLLICLSFVLPKALIECDTEAVFGGAFTLLRNVCPSPLPAECGCRRVRRWT